MMHTKFWVSQAIVASGNIPNAVYLIVDAHAYRVWNIALRDVGGKIYLGKCIRLLKMYEGLPRVKPAIEAKKPHLAGSA